MIYFSCIALDCEILKQAKIAAKRRSGMNTPLCTSCIKVFEMKARGNGNASHHHNSRALFVYIQHLFTSALPKNYFLCTKIAKISSQHISTTTSKNVFLPREAGRRKERKLCRNFIFIIHFIYQQEWRRYKKNESPWDHAPATWHFNSDECGAMSGRHEWPTTPNGTSRRSLTFCFFFAAGGNKRNCRWIHIASAIRFIVLLHLGVLLMALPLSLSGPFSELSSHTPSIHKSCVHSKLFLPTDPHDFPTTNKTFHNASISTSNASFVP